MPIRVSGWLVLLLVVSACASQQIDTPIPTQTLIPPTITPTASPIMPTQTPEDLPEPQDFNLTPSPTPLVAMIENFNDFEVGIVELTRDDLAENTGVPADRLQLMRVRPRLYVTVDCPTGLVTTPPPLSHGLEVIWAVDDQTHTYLTWNEEQFTWCEIDRLRGEYLTALDPIAAELSALAVRRVNQRSDAPLDAITLVDILPVVWQDSSLGCPQDDVDYTDMRIDGYRIIVSDGETSYLFHTDSVQLVPCDFEQASN